MFNLLAKAQAMERAGKQVIHFEIGDPNFNSPPHAIEAAKRALDGNLTHYTDSRGMFEFRQAVADYVALNWGFRPSLAQILASPANANIDFVARCVVNPGEEIIYPDPGFPTYYSAIRYNGFIPVGVKVREENGFRLNPDDIRKSITDKTRLIIINSPQNPTGAVMTEAEILEVAKIAEKHDLYLFSDEVYAQITYDCQHFSPSVVDRCQERTIINYGLSKTYSMSGWRLGFVVGPEPLVGKMGILMQTIFSCLPPFVQRGGMAALSGDPAFLEERIKILKRRRDIMIQGLNSLPGISCVTPQGSIYAFPNIVKTGLSGEDFSAKLLEEAGVCTCPGENFGKNGEGYVRLCYASANEEQIQEALARMRGFLQLVRPTRRRASRVLVSAS